VLYFWPRSYVAHGWWIWWFVDKECDGGRGGRMGRRNWYWGVLGGLNVLHGWWRCAWRRPRREERGAKTISRDRSVVWTCRAGNEDVQEAAWRRTRREDQAAESMLRVCFMWGLPLMAFDETLSKFTLTRTRHTPWWLSFWMIFSNEWYDPDALGDSYIWFYRYSCSSYVIYKLCYYLHRWFVQWLLSYLFIFVASICRNCFTRCQFVIQISFAISHL